MWTLPKGFALHRARGVTAESVAMNAADADSITRYDSFSTSPACAAHTSKIR
jgi:hypothetical protein